MDKSYWKEEYEKLQPTYKKLTEKTENLLKDVCDSEDIKATFESRTKSIKSFLEKITRPSKSYTNPLLEITDFVGIRIILNSLDDVKRVAEIIKNEFEVDTEKSVNKFEQLDPDRFGYLSDQYIVKVGESRRNLPEWNQLNDLFIEIQVRTYLQHAWASVEHFLVYKTQEDVPRSVRRRLARLIALFELADEELNNIIRERLTQSIEYRNELEIGNTKIDVNIDSIKTYIQSSEEPKYWINFLRENIRVKISDSDWGDLSRDVKFANRFGLKSIKEIDNLLKSAHGWGEKFLTSYYSTFFRDEGVSASELTVVVNGVITQLLIASNAEKITEEELDEKFGWGNPDKLLNQALISRGLSS